MILIRRGKYNMKIQHTCTNISSLSPQECSILEKVPKQQYIDSWSLPLQNDSPIKSHIDNTGNIPVPLHPKNALHSIPYPIS